MEAENLNEPKSPALQQGATKTGIEMMLGLLIESGAMCPKCGYGTRVTSKRWAKCKKCGERVARNGT